MTKLLKKTIFTFLLFVGLFQNAGAQTPGAPYFIPTGNATSNGSAVVSAYSCSTASTGSMTMSTNVSGVTQTITATVTTVGTYSIAATTNGVTFSGSGTFAGTGAQNVVLVATGIPTAAGSGITFTLNTTPSCSFTRDIISGTSSNGTSTISSFSCTTASAGTMTVGTPVTGVTQTITAQVTATGTYAIATTANGVTFADSGTFSGTGSQNIVLTATGTPTTSGGAVSFTLNTAPNCSFSRAILDTSTNGTAVVSSYSCSTASTGTLIAGTAVSGVTQTITAQVTTAGTYSISTTANGVTFAGSGTFSGTGAQNIVLTATGTPTAIGTAFSFPLNTSPSCSFSRSVISTTSNGTALVSSYSCSTASAGTMTNGIAVSGVTQTITAQVTTVGTYSISTTANGVTFSGSGTFTGTGAQNIVLTATGTPTASGTGFTFTLNTTPTCSFTRDVLSNTSNGTAIISGFTCSTGSAGTMTKGTAITTGVSQTITAQVTTAGTYSISTTANGVTFAGSGTIVGTGAKTIVLTATGTPSAGGVYAYTLNTTPNCSFNRTIIDNSSNGSAAVNSYSCSTNSAGTMTNGITISTVVTQTITAQVATVGTYSISTTANGVTFAASGTFTGTGAQNIVLTATGTPTSIGTHTFTLNTTPNCSFNRATIQAPLPANITLSSVADYSIASVYDQDYMPYTIPTSAAELPSGPLSEIANGSNEAITINVQGTLTTTGVSIKIPYSASGSIALPAYNRIITIPATYTEDGISRDVSFSYDAATLVAGSGTIIATLKAVGNNLNVKKLDMQTGIGNDFLGVLLGQFTYSTNNSGGTTIFSFRAIPGILDKMFGLADGGADTTTHRFIYLPIVANDGNIWLNNNLGAIYSNVTNSNFNPSQQANTTNDYLAFGSLFQWGRTGDGHELVNRTSSTAVTSFYPALNARLNIPGTSKHFYYGFVEYLVTSVQTLWDKETGAFNPCPKGYRVPTRDEFLYLVSSESITNSATALASTLSLTDNGRHNGMDNTFVNSFGRYWTSTNAGSTLAMQAAIQTTVGVTNQNKSDGCAVRCIKD